MNPNDCDPNSLPVFDEPAMLQRLDGDRELARDIVEVALEQVPLGFTALAAAVDDDRWVDAQRAAHTLKGQLAQIGAARLAAKLAALDSAMKSGVHPDADRVAVLGAEFGTVAEALRAAFS